MKIEKYKVLTENKISEIRYLEKICKPYDGIKSGLFLDSSMNFYHDLDSTLLLYENKQLISVLFVFIPTSEQAEISGYTLPEHRKKGYFKLLFKEALEQLKNFKANNVLFNFENQSLSGKLFAESIGAKYEFSEYLMKFHSVNKLILANEIKVVEMNENQIEQVVKVSISVFGDTYENAYSLVKNSFFAENKIQYIAMLENEIIGIGAMSFENEQSMIYGVGIKNEYQGKGYGKALILKILEKLKNKDNVFIEVERNNNKAFNLYLKSGFIIDTQFDYYKLDIS